jgi:hypothetical protein
MNSLSDKLSALPSKKKGQEPGRSQTQPQHDMPSRGHHPAEMSIYRLLAHFNTLKSFNRCRQKMQWEIHAEDTAGIASPFNA